jgi:hypothetical protein
MANPSIKHFELVKASIFDVDGTEYDITNAVTVFSYYEDIYSPFVNAVLNVIDSGLNLIATMPIQGGERVVVKIKNIQEEIVEYDMHVFKVYNRVFSKNIQMYNLALVSREALYNEGVRIFENLNGLSDEIVNKILVQYLKTEKPIVTEKAKFKINFFPNGKKAHSIIQSIMMKSVPENSKFESSKNSKTNKSNSSITQKTKKASGTAGYLFFETKNGFVFESMDKLCSDGSDNFNGTPPKEKYYSKPVMDTGAEENLFIIEEYKFDNEIDMIDQMRNGIFSTYIVFYNYSTGQYDEYIYNMADTFKNMSHLGSQTALPKFQTEMGENPTRVMSMVIDHETWFDGGEIANPDEKGKAPFPDYQKYYISQGIARRYLMENQKMELTIPGNSNLVVGDKIEVFIPNMVPEAERAVKKYDEESSGTYLIAKLSHNFQVISDSNTPQFVTKLQLIRDSYGIKNYKSSVK